MTHGCLNIAKFIYWCVFIALPESNKLFFLEQKKKLSLVQLFQTFIEYHYLDANALFIRSNRCNCKLVVNIRDDVYAGHTTILVEDFNQVNSPCPLSGLCSFSLSVTHTLFEICDPPLHLPPFLTDGSIINDSPQR